MEHILDNPAWNALLTVNKHLGGGNEQAKYFKQQVAPFVGLKDNSAENFERLYNLMPHDSPVVFISPEPVDIPQQWKIARRIVCYQMMYEGVYDTEQRPTVLLTDK